jgi:hypothetical protein
MDTEYRRNKAKTRRRDRPTGGRDNGRWGSGEQEIRLSGCESIRKNKANSPGFARKP